MKTPKTFLGSWRIIETEVLASVDGRTGRFPR